ncbi:4Fe-4S binding protein [Myxococcota bacterium]|nr:4Fe-4S binding protein [Myxococcota bacterium]MBU1534054.1 4Fe-4S binding protein [Myxococcota bacterium]
MPKKNSLISYFGVASLVVTFALMCIAQLWYTMFLLFGFALLVVLMQGKNTYCAHYCPLGTLQDVMGEKSQRVRAFRGVRWLKFLLIPVFWAAVIYTTYRFRSHGAQLWVWMLRIMVSMFFLAMVLQELLGKRFFCVHLCPLRHPVLEPARRARNCAVKGCGGSGNDSSR